MEEINSKSWFDRKISKEKKLIKNEDYYEFKDKKYLVRIGIIDLEGKLYTKIPTYI